MKLNRSMFVGMVTIVLATLFLITGCNTAKGFGQDMQESGQAIQKAVNK